MQFMVYDPNFDPETATVPTPEQMAEMGKFIGAGLATIGLGGAAQPEGHTSAALRG